MFVVLAQLKLLDNCPESAVMSEESKAGPNLQMLLHDALIRTQHVERCAIIRRRDASLRAASLGYVVCYVLSMLGYVVCAFQG